MFDSGNVRLYYLTLGEVPAIIMRLDHKANGTFLCLTFSRVGGRSFLNQCLNDGILSKVDFESFEKIWELYCFPDFHYEDETIMDGHAAEQLTLYLEVYVDLFNHDYDFTEVYNLFREESTPIYGVPYEYKECPIEVAPKDLSAILVGYGTDTVKYFFDKRDALTLVTLHEDSGYKKRTRKRILHSSLPDESFESVRTYTGLTGELISYLYWINYEFG